MIRTIDIQDLHCVYCNKNGNRKIAYILYPMDLLTDWIETAVEKYAVDIVVITGMDWESAMSPWPAKGVPKGSPDFKGDAPAFLKLLQDSVIPQIENSIGYSSAPERTLFGVSMSGLFTLWQWLECDTFVNIASLSGSFWYEGFPAWVESLEIPQKQGMAYFLLGDQEAKSKVKAFDSVAVNTQTIISLLKSHGIKTEFQNVPGNHYSDPIPRLTKAFSAIYSFKE